MKTKQITALLLLVCIILTPVLTSSASAHAYDHVYTDITIVTPDSFEDVFGVTEVERAAYTYQMVELNNSKAVVALEMELKIGHDYYTTVVSGDIPAYTLPSEDILYEGPISGTMTVGEDEYRVTAGFAKLESTGDVLVSVTLQSNSIIVAFSFGENLIEGEVLNFFMEKTGNGQPNNPNGLNTIGNLDSTEFGNNPGDTASTMVMPGFSPIMHPGDTGGYTPLGENGEYIFQNVDMARFTENGRVALESRVYWYQNFNIMAVTVHPCSDNAQLYATQLYVNTYGFDTVSAFLDSFKIQLSLQNTGITAAQHARISSIILSNEESTNEFNKLALYFPAVLKDLLAMIKIRTNTLSVAIDDIRGSINGHNNDYYGEINVDMSLSASLLDDLDCGVPFYFGLYRPVPETYEGNTPYTVTVTATYQYLTALYGDNFYPSYSIYYATFVNVHDDYLNLNPT